MTFAFALLLRLAVPQGWMPVSDAGGTRLVICTGEGPLPAPGAPAVARPMQGMHHHMPGGHHDPGAGDHSCPFSSLAMALAEPFVPLLGLPERVAGTIASPSPHLVAIGRGLAAPPPPSTGPPHGA